MATWTPDQLTRIGEAEELHISFLRADDTLGDPRTIWVARVGDDLYVRSVNGRDSAWFRGVLRRHAGHIQAGGVDADVTFTEPGGGIDDDLDAAYLSKYHHYAAAIVGRVTSQNARSATLKVNPA